MRIAESKDNFWTSFRDLKSLGFTPDRPTVGHDCELHATAAILSTGPVGVGDYIAMTNASIINRLARADGVLLRPDRPLAPMDVLVTGLIGLRGLSNGARLWMTHATVAAEDPDCPELAASPTRRLVSHTGVDATRVKTVEEALLDLNLRKLSDRNTSIIKARSWVGQHTHTQNSERKERLGRGGFHFQWLIMSVDVPSMFSVLASDLYPSPISAAMQATSFLYVREWHWPRCMNNTDAIASGCLREVAFNSTSSNLSAISSTPIFDARTDSPYGTTCKMCDHSFALWSVFPSEGQIHEIIVLGDLTKTVSLSGYRLRINPKEGVYSLVVVGAPGEEVELMYLVRDSQRRMIVHVIVVVVGEGGRSLVNLG